jgi:hypothetical protein
VPYLFFVAHPDGHHEFRTTFAEHQAAVREARRLRDAAARAPVAAPGAAPVSAPPPRRAASGS